MLTSDGGSRSAGGIVATMASMALCGSGIRGFPNTNASWPFQQTSTRMPTVAPNSAPTIRPVANSGHVAPCIYACVGRRPRQ